MACATIGPLSNRSTREGAYLLTRVGVGCNQGLDVPVLYVGRLHPGPLQAARFTSVVYNADLSLVSPVKRTSC
jgi:hypothetical protein